jgi:hypothetical protein
MAGRNKQKLEEIKQQLVKIDPSVQVISLCHTDALFRGLLAVQLMLLQIANVGKCASLAMLHGPHSHPCIPWTLLP